jgi:hypothetical protein
MNVASNMKKNLIHIIYPDEFSSSFIMETEGKVDDSIILERVFAQWNNGSRQESELFVKSQKRSVSVNDIVHVNGNYYQCASMGWDAVTPDYVTKLIEEVANHPKRSENGAYRCLDDIMWQRKKKTA